MPKIYKNDVGTKFIVSTEADLTGATSHKLIIRKPDKSTIEWTTKIEGNATEGEISYITKNGDLDQAGLYKGNAYVEFGSYKFTGETFQFIVFELFG